MNITILGGHKEIGGNKILVEHKGTKILLDFGMSFSQAGKYFSEFLQPRKCASLTDFFEFGLLPQIKGIYREDYLSHMNMAKEEKEVDGVFISHAHADHAQYIHFLRFDIPIYCTRATEVILRVLEETGSNPLSEFITACEAFTFYTNRKGTLSRVTRKNTDFVHVRDIEVMEAYQKVKVGSLEVELVPVDHSLPGACGYIVYSDAGNLVYTGDIRFHGSNQELSKEFVKRAKAAEPRWLLSEGTRIDSKERDSEEGVKRKIAEFIAESKFQLVFVEHPIKDLDRVTSIFEAAKENNRHFVVNLKLAYLINELDDLCPFALDEVEILVPRKSWGLIDKEGIDSKLVEQDYSVWERAFINRANCITYHELQRNPAKYVVSMSLWELNQLTDIKPSSDAIWIKSSCEPFCDEMELDEERKRNWLEHFKIKEYFAHASGHASGDEIRAMIKEINPEELIPIHTEHPELF